MPRKTTGGKAGGEKKQKQPKQQKKRTKASPTEEVPPKAALKTAKTAPTKPAATAAVPLPPLGLPTPAAGPPPVPPDPATADAALRTDAGEAKGSTPLPLQPPLFGPEDVRCARERGSFVDLKLRIKLPPCDVDSGTHTLAEVRLTGDRYHHSRDQLANALAARGYFCFTDGGDDPEESVRTLTTDGEESSGGESAEPNGAIHTPLSAFRSTDIFGGSAPPAGGRPSSRSTPPVTVLRLPCCLLVVPTAPQAQDEVRRDVLRTARSVCGGLAVSFLPAGSGPCHGTALAPALLHGRQMVKRFLFQQLSGGSEAAQPPATPWSQVLEGVFSPDFFSSDAGHKAGSSSLRYFHGAKITQLEVCSSPLDSLRSGEWDVLLSAFSMVYGFTPFQPTRAAHALTEALRQSEEQQQQQQQQAGARRDYARGGGESGHVRREETPHPAASMTELEEALGARSLPSLCSVRVEAVAPTDDEPFPPSERDLQSRARGFMSGPLSLQDFRSYWQSTLSIHLPSPLPGGFCKVRVCSSSSLASSAPSSLLTYPSCCLLEGGGVRGGSGGATNFASKAREQAYSVLHGFAQAVRALPCVLGVNSRGAVAITSSGGSGQGGSPSVGLAFTTASGKAPAASALCNSAGSKKRKRASRSRDIETPPLLSSPAAAAAVPAAASSRVTVGAEGGGRGRGGRGGTRMPAPAPVATKKFKAPARLDTRRRVPTPTKLAFPATAPPAEPRGKASASTTAYSAAAPKVKQKRKQRTQTT